MLNPFELMDFKNTANTGVLPWAGQLYALWEVRRGARTRAQQAMGLGPAYAL